MTLFCILHSESCILHANFSPEGGDREGAVHYEFLSFSLLFLIFSFNLSLFPVVGR